jgi:hypothetical protein
MTTNTTAPAAKRTLKVIEGGDMSRRATRTRSRRCGIVVRKTWDEEIDGLVSRIPRGLDDNDLILGWSRPERIPSRGHARAFDHAGAR